MSLIRFGVSINERLLEKFDSLITEKGYANRSEALRDLIRNFMVEREWDENEDTVGTITVVYSHEIRELTDTLTDIQHHYHKAIISSLHVHLDAHNCMEVLVVKGKARDISKIADRIIGTRGVKHGKLTMTTTGKTIY
ncbi:MAG: nickel-responsive transcriptional regulator NikR [Nitrospirota bacterium]